MVKYSSPALDATFGALADPTRRAILAQLARGQASVTQLAARFDISLPGVMKHVRVLEEARLLASAKDGRVRHCRLEPERLRDASEWIAFYRQFWEQQLDNLARYFEETEENPEKEKETWPPKPSPQPRSKSSAPSPRRRTRSSTRGRNRRS